MKTAEQPSKPQPNSSKPFVPDDITRDDFFRLVRVGNCWQVEMVRVSRDRLVFRRKVYAEDVLSSSEAKLRRYAVAAEQTR